MGKRLAASFGSYLKYDTIFRCSNACCEVVECFETMEEKSSTDNMHKEEKKSRISYDKVDRDIPRKKI